MNQRTTEMIKLLSTSKGELSLNDLAQQFQVSQRTIRNDLNEINGMLKQNKLPQIQLKSRGRLELPDTFADSVSLLIADDFYTYKLSKEERKHAAAAMIVGSADYVTLATIADSLFVSRATIIADLKDIKAYVKEAKLEVISHTSKGLRANGWESDKRRFLLMLTVPAEETESKKNFVSKHVSVQAGDRVVIQKILTEQEHRHKAFFTDRSFKRILVYLGIMVNRNLQGAFLEPQPEITSEYYPLAQDILKYITQYCNVITTKDDVRFLCDMLTRARYMGHSSFEKNVVKIQMISRQFIESVSAELGINLNMDYEFFENLSNHLESVFSAPPMHYPEQDVIREVLEDNQDIVEVVHHQLPILHQYVGRQITEMEINYIAIHICAAIERKKNKEIAFHVIVACHTGIGTSQLLLEKLKQHFNFHIVDVISAHQATRIDRTSVDLAISTIELKDCPVDYIVVAPTFNDEDYIRVGNKIDALRNSRHLPSRLNDEQISAKGLIEKITPLVYETAPEQADVLMKKLRGAIRDYFHQSVEAEAEIFSPYLHHLLVETHIQLDVECTDWKDAVRKSAQTLLEHGYIEDRYIDSMIASIEKYGPYVVLSPGFAMPHDRVEQGSNRLGMNLIRLKTPVSFGAGDLDPIEFVCCLSAIDHKSHLKAFFNLMNMLEKPEFKQLLHDCRTAEQAVAVIEKFEYSVMS